METDGQEIWNVVRKKVLALGSLEVIQQLLEAGEDMEDAFAEFLNDQDPAEIRDVLGVSAGEGSDPQDVAIQALRQIAKRRRVSSQRRRDFEELLLRFLDAWAGADAISPGLVAGKIVRSAGRHVATCQFNSGYPGSGQSMSAYRYGRAIIVVNADYGACEIHGSVRELLAGWLKAGFDESDIHGPAVTSQLLKSIDRA
jgi:hypothetical protein